MSAPCSGSSVRSSMPRASRSRIRGTTGEWNSRRRCPRICSPYLTTSRGTQKRQTIVMDKPILPHEIRKVYEGRVFTVAVESITLPKGHRLDVEVVRHPGSVVLLPIDAAGDVMLVRQYRHA